jgi:hypothetical protein
VCAVAAASTGAWGVPCPSVADYVAMPGAHRRGDRRRTALMSTILNGAVASRYAREVVQDLEAALDPEGLSTTGRARARSSRA